MALNKVPARRLFFALLPDDSARRSLAKLQDQLNIKKGRKVHVADLHVTLFFLGMTNREQETCVTEAAGRIASEPFQLCIDRADCWPRPKVVWAGAGEVPETLKTLVSDMNGELGKCGFSADKREYKPHVTLYRKSRIREQILLDQAICWQVTKIALLESQPGGEPPYYHVRRTWDLA